MIADEFVAFESGGDLEGEKILATLVAPLRAYDFPNAAKVDGLRAIVIESDHVLDGTAQVGLEFGGEQNPSGADVLGESRQRDAFRPRSSDRERELEFETSGPSLFHESS
jgi:hypothetical protein